MFLFKELLKSIIFTKKKRIGFIFPGLPLPYNRIMASTRLRVYDSIKMFKGNDRYFLEIYKPWKKYDIVIFQKKFDKKALLLAKKIRMSGAKIVLDINVNYYDHSFLSKDLKYQYNDIIKFTEISDSIITTTSYIRDYIIKLFPHKKVSCIPESISENFFFSRKINENIPLRLTYAGYSVKAKEVLAIKDVLEDLHKKYKFSLLFICEKDPKLEFGEIGTEFIKYKQSKIAKQLLHGDIFISPRDLSNPYNLGHSFTKIGYPMSVGIPVIADEVPSYLNSPAIICTSEEDWRAKLEKLLSDESLRRNIGRIGVEYCKQKYSTKKIKVSYEHFFNSLSYNK